MDTSSGDLQLVRFKHFASSGFPTKFETLLGIIHQHLPWFLLNIVLFSCFFSELRTSSTKKSKKNTIPQCVFVAVFLNTGMLGIPWLGNPRWIVAQLFRFDGNGSRPRGRKVAANGNGSRTIVGGPLNAKFEACVF